MEVLDHLHALVFRLLDHLDGWEELLGDRDQRVARPRLEPIYGAAVYQWREHPDSGPEGVSDRTETQDDVEVPLHYFHEELEQLQRARFIGSLVFGLVERPDLLHDFSFVLSYHKIRHLRGVQQRVYVLHEAFQFDLIIGE